MNSVNKLIEKVEALSIKIDMVDQGQTILGIKIFEALSRIEAQGFSLKESKCEPKDQKVKLSIPITHSNHTVKYTFLNESDWLGDSTVQSYGNHLQKFKKHIDIFIQIMDMRNSGYSMEEIQIYNKDKIPFTSVSGIYNCINAARRFNHVTIEKNKYVLTDCDFEFGGE